MSMKIKIEIEADSPAEAALYLTAISNVATKAGLPVDGNPGAAKNPATKKVLTESAPEPADAAPVVAKAVEAKPAPALDMAALRTKINAAVAAKGEKVVAALFAQFGAAKLSGIPADKLSELHTQLDAL
jgi:hypothetical protein